MATSAIVAALQIPEGFTVRKVGKSLKVVKARVRKIAIVAPMVIENKNWDDWAEALTSQKEKDMLKAVRIIDKGYGFGWYSSLIKTLVVNQQVTFTAQEMYDALVGVALAGEDMDSLSRVETTLERMMYGPGPVRLEKAGNAYKVKFLDRSYSECK